MSDEHGVWERLPRPIRALAPMEDVTDTVYRRLLRTWAHRLAPGSMADVLMFTEFTRVDRARFDPRLKFSASERPLIAQIWGTRPEEYFDAAVEIESRGFDGIDLNMGCPARKIRSVGACSALIANPALAREIIAACREASSLPLSVKTRIGLKKPVTETWCGMLLEQPIDALTVHPRTADQQSEGQADWNEIARVVQLRGSDAWPLIIGNGDIHSAEEARARVEESGADGVMIGRGIFADPFLFARPQIASAEWASLPTRIRIGYLREHIETYVREWSGSRSYDILKKFFRSYVDPLRAGSALLDDLYQTASGPDAIACIDRFMDA